jgi:cyanophycinase-like exopeptidase
MALCEWTLVRARMPGDERRRYVPALGLVPGVAFLPHYDTFGHRWVSSASERDGVTLLGVDERTAAVWRDGSWEAMGAGAVTVIVAGDRRRFEPGSTVEGLPEPA